MIFVKADRKRMRFVSKTTTAEAQNNSATITVLYNSGTDGSHLSEGNRARTQMPILQKSTTRVDVANGGTSTATNVTTLPILRLPKDAAEANTFEDVSTSLLSVGKVNDDGNVSIFTKQGVSVHKEEDVLITVKGQPVVIGKHNERGSYQILLV